MDKNSTNLRIKCQDGSLLAFIAGDLPESLRRSLLANVTDSFQPYLEEPMWQTKSLDDQPGTEEDKFFTLHFQHYFCMAMKASHIVRIMGLKA